MLQVVTLLLLFTVHTYGQNCTFDDPTEPLCGYTMRYGNDNFDWTLQSGSTPTEDTGPDADHSGEGKYIYASAVVEGTEFERTRGAKARVVSPTITTLEKGKLLRFYSYMYGKGVGVMNVFILYEGVTKLPRPIWRRTGNRQQKWKLGEVVLPKNKAFRIVFESVVGKGKYGDIAIDDITIKDLAWNCNFEKDTCSFLQHDGDDFDWTRNTGKTGTKGTGPPIDHTRETSKGSYMYIESTDQVGYDRAVLISRPFTKNPDRYCGLSFFYHMMGINIGALNLYLLYGNKTGFEQPVWTDVNSYANVWIENVVYLNDVTGLFQVAFEGVRGIGGHKGDIAIDDIKLLGDGCSVYPNGNCTVNPCLHDGSCIEMVGGVVCNCTDGHSGNLCGTVDLCAFTPCHNGGSCQQVGATGFACRCPIEWTGTTCTESTATTNKVTTVAPTTAPDATPTRLTTGSATQSQTDPPASPQSQIVQTTPDVKPQTTSPTTSPIPRSPVITTQEPTVQKISRAIGTYATEEYDVDVTVSPYLVTTETVTYIDHCLTFPCKHGDCLDDLNGYRCQCYPGWRGDTCGEDIDECTESVNICVNNGTCANTAGSHKCTCADGWMGENCEEECADNNFSCDYWAGTNECSINPSYMLKYCQFSCGVCQQYVCEDRHENCALWASIGECRNNPFYMLSMCHMSCGVCLDDECSTHPCKNGGICTDLEDDYSCTCASGWGGINCHIPLDECDSGPCQNNGTCLDSISYYQCVCTDGYEGVNCENETNHCSNDPCLNGGQCVDIRLDYSCTCADGFFGKSCENDTNECLSNPCQHGGTCLDQAGSYLCECPAEWTGVNCEHDFDECQSNPCINGGSCFHGIGRRFYLCRCISGYEGLNCELETNECMSNPCRSGATCKDLLGEYQCICQPGYTGSKCQLPVNECASNPCQNNAKCLDMVNSYACLCPPLYKGTNCETRVRRCTKSPCINKGVCNEESEDIRTLCTCPPQWEGIYCEISKFIPTTLAPTTTPLMTTVTRLTTQKISLTTEEPEASGAGSTSGSTKTKFAATTTRPTPTAAATTEKQSTHKPLTKRPVTTEPPIPSTPVPQKTTPSVTTISPTKRMRTTSTGNDAITELPNVETNRSPKNKETSLFLIICIAAGTFTLAVIIIILISVKVCRRNTGGRYEQFPLDSTAGGFTWASESSGGSLAYQKFMDSEPTLNDASAFKENSSF